VSDDGDVANALGHGACVIRLAWSGMELNTGLRVQLVRTQALKPMLRRRQK
jgi:hypothetical protein